jgi:CRISPR-associated protein Cas2
VEHLVVTYDVADDGRRQRLATLLSAYGPRVQLSVFECRLDTPKAARDLRGRIRELIDAAEDQVRVYRLSAEAANQVAVIGAREVEERADFWIVR